MSTTPLKVKNNLPSWVPEAVSNASDSIRTRIEQEHERGVMDDVQYKAQIAALDRLTSDPRMKTVWAELYKKKRVEHHRIEEWLYPGIVYPEAKSWSSQPPVSPDEIHNYAVKQLFEHAHHLAMNKGPLVGAVQLAQDKETLLKVVDSLLENAERLRHLNVEFWEGEQREFIIQELERYAAECAKEAGQRDLDVWEGTVALRQRGNDEVRGYVAWIGSTINNYFASTLYGTVATIANVALDRADVTAGRVRETLRPGAKA